MSIINKLSPKFSSVRDFISTLKYYCGSKHSKSTNCNRQLKDLLVSWSDFTTIPNTSQFAEFSDSGMNRPSLFSSSADY